MCKRQILLTISWSCDLYFCIGGFRLFAKREEIKGNAPIKRPCRGGKQHIRSLYECNQRYNCKVFVLYDYKLAYAFSGISIFNSLENEYIVSESLIIFTISFPFQIKRITFMPAYIAYKTKHRISKQPKATFKTCLRLTKQLWG